MIGKTVQKPPFLAETQGSCGRFEKPLVYAEIEFLVSKMITVMVSTDRMSHALCRSLLV